MYGRTPPTALMQSIINDDQNAFEKAIKEEKDINRTENVSVPGNGSEIWTPLLAAVHLNRLAMIAILLEQGAVADQTPRGRNATPLGMATYYNSEEDVIELLLKADADPNQKSMGLTPLMYAASKNNKNTVLRLLEYGAHVDVKSDEGNTALSYAVGDPEILRILLQQPGAVRVINCGSRGEEIKFFGCTESRIPLMAAINARKEESVRLLLEKKETRVDRLASDRWCATPFIYAARKSEACAKLLLADPRAQIHINDDDMYGVTALSNAARYRHVATLETCLDLKADINHESNSHKTALHYAVECDYSDEYEKSTEIVRILLDRGIDEKYVREISKDEKRYQPGDRTHKSASVFEKSKGLMNDVLMCEDQLRFLEEAEFKDMPASVSQLNFEPMTPFPRRFSLEQIAKRVQNNSNLSSEEKEQVMALYASVVTTPSVTLSIALRR
jgi:ankyrin repeat protein